MQTILITGCSSGFGLETAKYFFEQGWNVVATMRTPDEKLLPPSKNLRILSLDVANAESIQAVIKAAGPVDALVNNAGIGSLNALQGETIESIRQLFETNTFGTMAMMQAVLPQMIERKSGVVVNVTSTVTLKPLPLLSVYTASKAAINAFTESVAFELEPFNIRVRLVLPGLSPSTSFGANARVRMTPIPDAYAELAQGIFARMGTPSEHVTHPVDVAKAVWRAVTDPSTLMRSPAGVDALEWAANYR